MTSAQRLHGQDGASFGALCPQCGAQTVSAALPQEIHGETPVLCVIMIYHSPIMTSAQRLHGQDRASFGAQWPQCGAQIVSAALPQKTHAPCFVCNNDLPQSNHDFCTKAAWPRPSQFWSIVPTMWGTNSECSIAAKNTWLDPSFVCTKFFYHSPTMTSAQRLHGQDRASFGALCPQCGAQTVSAALPQKTHGETPVLCVIMIYHSPIMTSAQRVHGQDRASFEAQWPQCGAQTVSAALPQKTHGETPVLCAIMIYHSPTMTWPRPSQFWGTVATMWSTNSECSIAAKNTRLDPSFVCNNDLPQSNHDFCTKAAWPRPSQFWGTVATMWGTNSECSIAAKTHGETPVLCVIMIYHSPTMTSAQRLHGQDRASFGALCPQCGAQTVSAALPQEIHGETPVLCVIMIYHSPTMTSAQRVHGQDRASFGAQWPQCGAQTVSAPLPQKTHGETPVLCAIMIYHSPTMTSAQRLHGQDRASFGAQWHNVEHKQCHCRTMWGTVQHVSAALPQMWGKTVTALVVKAQFCV